MAVTVIAGGPRSGKSRFALSLAAAQGPRLGFIATRLPLTAEAEAETLRLRAERRDALITWEEPVDVADVVGEHLPLLDALVVDDASEWLSNLAAAGRGTGDVDRLFTLAADAQAHLILVASDTAGHAEQLTSRAEHLFQVTDGIPVRVR